MDFGRQKGFTLIELMFAMGIGILLIALTATSMQAFVLNNRQVSSINEFIASIQFARSEAVTRNNRITICASVDGINCAAATWEGGWLIFNDRDGDQVVDAGEIILRAVGQVDGMQIRSGVFGNFFVYRPNGRVMTNVVNVNTGQFTFCDRRGPEKARVIIIDVSGRPRGSDKQADGNNPVCV